MTDQPWKCPAPDLLEALRSDAPAPGDEAKARVAALLAHSLGLGTAARPEAPSRRAWRLPLLVAAACVIVGVAGASAYRAAVHAPPAPGAKLDLRPFAAPRPIPRSEIGRAHV
jgi:hypothetical protein